MKCGLIIDSRLDHMKRLLLLFAMCPFASLASDAQAEQAAFEASMAYIESVAMPKRAKVCGSLDSTYTEKFEARIPGWLKANAALISAGREELERRAAESGVPFEEDIQRVTDLDLEILSQAPAELQKENCDFYIESLVDG